MQLFEKKKINKKIQTCVFISLLYDVESQHVHANPPRLYKERLCPKHEFSL